MALIVPLQSVQAQPALEPTPQGILASHWVPGWGFRDELNVSDIDHENFWTDNAGKVLMESLVTNDTIDAGRAFGFIQSHMTTSYYLPEVLVNSSMIKPWSNPGNLSLSNGIVLLWGSNGSLSERGNLTQLSLGDYYASPQREGYLGADRIWYDDAPHAANSSVVYANQNGFVKKAFFSFSGLSFYTYLNVTMKIGEPHVKVSLQVQPTDSTFGAGDHAYLQVFAGANGTLKQYAFENATAFDANASLGRTLPFKQATPQSSGGLVITYSNRTSTLDQDSVALRFNATGIDDIEHWYEDGAFGGLSWVGLGYDVNETGPGALSAPVYTDVYPIEHVDYHLLSDTAKYIVSNPRDVSVAPPVSFGFLAEGLALEANLNPNNQTIQRLASSYWNYYYSRYNSSLYGTPYARSVNIFALAGFKLNGCNSTMESFTRRFLSNTSGDSIEEYAWAVASLNQLYECTHLQKDYALYQSFLGSLSAGGSHFMALDQNSKKNELEPNSTFEFGETASGLMLGGVPFNYPTVISAMNAVYQSNVKSAILNTPYHGDEVNTETLPAYTLSTWLFEGEIRNETGYWITGLENTNVTSIAYSDGALLIQAVGNIGSSLTVTNKTGSYVYPVEGFETITLKLTTPPCSEVVMFLSGALIGAVVAGVPVYLVSRRHYGRLARCEMKETTDDVHAKPSQVQEFKPGMTSGTTLEQVPAIRAAPLGPESTQSGRLPHPLILGVLSCGTILFLYLGELISSISSPWPTSTENSLMSIGLPVLLFATVGNSLIVYAVTKYRYGNGKGIGSYAAGTVVGTVIVGFIFAVFFVLALLFSIAASGGQ